MREVRHTFGLGAVVAVTLLVASGAGCSSQTAPEDVTGLSAEVRPGDAGRPGRVCVIDRVIYSEGERNPANPCETCQPDVSRLAWVDAAAGTSCDDGNACTQSDSCEAGVCVGADPVECAASDACHVAGTCDPATGACSNPIAPDDTACNDGDACTQSDSCQAGVCVGADPVTCTAVDQCHVAGTCDPATGACSNPIAANGASCDDSNSCTLNDSCQLGRCVGGSWNSACPEYSITSLSVSPYDINECRYQWAATVQNHTTLASPTMTLQGYQEDSSAGGTSVGPIPGLGSDEGRITFVHDGSTSLSVVLWRDGAVIAEEATSLPQRPDPASTLSLRGFADSATGDYYVAIEHPETIGYPMTDSVLQLYSSASPTGPWEPAGGEVVGCIPPGEGYQKKVVSYAQRYVWAQVKTDNVIIVDQVFDTAAP